MEILLGVLTCLTVYIVYKLYCNKNEVKIGNGFVTMVQQSGNDSVQVQVAHVNHVKQVTSVFVYSSNPPEDTGKLWINTQLKQLHFYNQ